MIPITVPYSIQSDSKSNDQATFHFYTSYCTRLYPEYGRYSIYTQSELLIESLCVLMDICWLESCRAPRKYKNPMQGITFFNRRGWFKGHFETSLQYKASRKRALYQWYSNCLTNRFIFRSKAPLYHPGWV